jgi:pyridoxine 4-dehydrogenase
MTLSQLMLAWLLQKSPVMVPIPGTSSITHLEENVAAQSLQLTAEDTTVLERIANAPAS